MYKCKECGLKYNDKPDYCDCGNDEFEIITAEEKQIPPILNSEDENNQKITKFEINSNNSFDKKTHDAHNFFSSIDLISGGIFTFCIILSFYIIFFAWNTKDKNLKTEQPIQASIQKNIPPINSFWNNTLPKTEQSIKKEEKKETQKIVEVKIIKPKADEIKANPSKQKTNSVKTTGQNKIAQNKIQQNSQTKKAQQKQEPPKQNQAVKTSVSEKTADQIASEKAETAKKALLAKEELETYKSSLRNVIGRKIDFTKVVGDGNCTVAFKINQSGKLVNRSFAKQSENITLNDAVYAAIMSTPTYKAPPASYNNETLRLNISFYNGNFEISLK